MAARIWHGDQLVISCEHASNRIPPRYRNLGLSVELRQSHIAWDAGAKDLARQCARQFACAYHAGKYARVLIDLNRSFHNRQLIPRSSFGVPIPGNRALTGAERDYRVKRFYTPYREAVLRTIRAIIGRRRTCLHLSIHTFVPRYAGVLRRADLGILYDPTRKRERDVAARLATSLRQGGYVTRRNYPYRGNADGFTTHCRGLFPATAYLGIEVEANQRLVNDASQWPSVRRAIVRLIASALTA